MASHIRRKQLKKAQRWCVRHEAEKFVKVTMSEIIESLVQEGAICPNDNSCTIKKVSPDGDIWIDINVTVPVHKYRVDLRLE